MRREDRELRAKRKGGMYLNILTGKLMYVHHFPASPIWRYPNGPESVIKEIRPEQWYISELGKDERPEICGAEVWEHLITLDEAARIVRETRQKVTS